MVPQEYEGRVAALEAYSRTHHDDIEELRREIRGVRDVVDCIRMELAGAKMAGRVALGIAMALGGIAAWFIKIVTEN